jgi:hypothetical protein
MCVPTGVHVYVGVNLRRGIYKNVLICTRTMNVHISWSSASDIIFEKCYAQFYD